MKLNSLHLENFRIFDQATVQFHPEVTVAVGSNGSGKTALLRAAAIAAGVIEYSLNPGPNKGIESSDLRTVNYQSGAAIGTEIKLPCIVQADGTVEDLPVSWEISQSSVKGRTRFGQAADLIKISKTYDKRLQNGDNSLILPLVSFYGAGRIWAQHKTKRNDVFGVSSRRNGYIDSLDSAANDKLMMEWFKRMRLKELQSDVQIPALRVVLNAMAKLYSQLSKTEVSKIEYNFDTNGLDVYADYHGKTKIIPSSQWSAGYKSPMFLVADIGYRMAILNPQLESDVLKKTPGIVIIDEIENHIHPAWQQKIIELLQKLFPKIQWIISTHAPAIIQSVGKENIILLDAGKVFNSSIQTFGKDANTILTDLMGTSSRPDQIQQMFTDFYESMDNEDYQKAEVTLDHLSSIIGEDDPDIQRHKNILSFEKDWEDLNDPH